jgi:hypothetical protein
MFNETFKTAVLSTAHLTPETLKTLNALEINRDLPYWVHPTDHGFIVRGYAVRFDVNAGGEDCLSSRPDIVAVFAALQAAGIDAALFDADGPIIDGLPDYSEDHA